MEIVINLDLQDLNRYEAVLVGEAGVDCGGVESHMLTATSIAMGIDKRKIGIDCCDEDGAHVMRLKITRGMPCCMGAAADALKAALESVGHSVTLNETNDYTQTQKAAMIKGTGDLKFDTDSLRRAPGQPRVDRDNR